MNKNTISFAIQSKGRLHEASVNFIHSLGINFERKGRELISHGENFDINILYLRGADIPEYVARGIVDFGIVGENVIDEKKLEVKKIKYLGFGKCKIVLAVPENSEIKTLEDLEGERVATSYSNILRNFLKKNNIRSSIIPIGGSCEIAPNINLADAICDITQTGNTLKENHLEILCEIMTSEAVLIESPIEKPIKNNFLNLL